MIDVLFLLFGSVYSFGCSEEVAELPPQSCYRLLAVIRSKDLSCCSCNITSSQEFKDLNS